MGCFIAPAAEAVVTTIVKKRLDFKEVGEDGEIKIECKSKNMFLRRLNWLNTMLWGGSALLAFEHVWHGEVVPWFPFLTAISNPTDTAQMLAEMSTVGVSMSVFVTAVWAGVVLVTNSIEKAPMSNIRVAEGGARK
ncbi:hypothetical protein M2454_001869 [Aequitasia blattaphilus]|uniref:Transmembrane protein n=1 Tax=Aequitasia blattaphilus TaxID=2949332 RepID=A0ABT1EBP1_9FIRM|nr:hypothetical protein [Aequitasia blattaphilus]MCP1102261.1 hypothetical protein [Aequitasia blattaphilus]MCR8614901.1 hypothetical protein [Aequitasia blattaphilus]